MQSSYKLIISDLDGTLLSEHSQLTTETINTIIQLQKKGIIFAINSGRPYHNCTQFIEQLKLSQYNGFFIGHNGQFIKSLSDNQEIQKEKLNQNDFEFLHDISSRIGVLAELYYEHQAYILFPKKHKIISLIFCFSYSLRSIIHQSKRYKIHYCFDVPHLPDIPKVCFLGKPSSLKKLANLLAKNDHYDTFFVNNAWLEVVRMGINKGAALHDLTKLTGITTDQMIAFGDGENDIEMLKVAGLGCAMKNAMPNTLRVSDYTCESNKDNGVAKKLKEIFNL